MIKTLFSWIFLKQFLKNILIFGTIFVLLIFFLVLIDKYIWARLAALILIFIGFVGIGTYGQVTKDK